MTNSPRGPLATAALASAAIAPPGVAIWLGKHADSLPLAVGSCLVYWIVLGLLTVLRPALRDVSSLWSERLSESLYAASLRWTSNYTRSVLAYARAANSHVESQGLITVGEDAFKLSEVYVSLVLDTSAVHSLEGNPVRYGKTGAATVHEIWTWLRHCRETGTGLVIVGPPGSGKTTILRHVAYTLAYGGRQARKTSFASRIPILIPLRRQSSRFLEEDPLLSDVITTALSDIDEEMPPDWVDHQLSQGRLLLLFDGLDEMADSDVRRNLSEWMNRQQLKYSATQFVLTSRPLGYKANPLDKATVLQVRRLTSSQIEQFVRNWYRATMDRRYGQSDQSSKLAAKQAADDLLDRVRANRSLFDLAANPLLLTMITNVHHHRGALPGTRCGLYAEVCQVFLGRRHQARGVPVDMEASQKQAILQSLAYHMMSERVREISAGDAEAVIRPVLARVSRRSSVEAFLTSIELASGLLVETEATTYSFAHLTIQEYLASVHIKEKNLLGTAQDLVEDSWWHEALRLYSAQADATPIVEACINGPSHMVDLVALAVDCIKEAHEISPDLRQKLESVISPKDLQDDALSRRFAAEVQARLRLRDLVKIDDDYDLSPTPVTCIEYQMFLESNPDNSQFAPDHWESSIFPQGCESQPITGLRLAAVDKYLEWFESQFIERAYQVSLPEKSQLTSPIARRAIAARATDLHSALVVEVNERQVAELILLPVREQARTNESTSITRQLEVDVAGNFLPQFLETLSSAWARIVVQEIQFQTKGLRMGLESLAPADLTVTADLTDWCHSLRLVPSLLFPEIPKKRPTDPDIFLSKLTSDYRDMSEKSTCPNLRPTEHWKHFVKDLQRVDGRPLIDVPQKTAVSQWWVVLVCSLTMALRRDAVARITPQESLELRAVARYSSLVLAHVATVAPNEVLFLQKRGLFDSVATIDKLLLVGESSYWLELYGQLANYEARITKKVTPGDGFYFVRGVSPGDNLPTRSGAFI